ncbi:MAG: hypothetical protein BMS9Abin36_2287 [Gammaproteobacteria bacterium]|nr:MAG: hypothetical protein BMS9Abin36_2287 [Gammaproteobacteria bacterium]
MATEYLARLTAIMAQVQLQLPDGTSLECRHFFGGAAVYAKGRIFLTLTPVGFALKLPEKARTCLLDQQGAKPLRYFAKGPIKKDYVVLPDVSPGNIDTLRKWVQLSVDYALSLPEKTLKVSKH